MNDIIEEIIRLSAPPLRQNGDFTCSEFVAEWESVREEELTERRAKRILDKMVRRGLLKTAVRYDITAGRCKNVWWTVDKKP